MEHFYLFEVTARKCSSYMIKWYHTVVYDVDGLCWSSPIAETEVALESEDGQVTTLGSALDSQNIPTDTVASFAAFGEAQMQGGKDNTKCSPSPLYYDNKTPYSSLVGLC